MTSINSEVWLKLLEETKVNERVWLPEEHPLLWRDLVKLLPEFNEQDHPRNSNHPESELDPWDNGLSSIVEVKEYAKAHLNNQETLIPREMAYALCYLSIIYAKLKLNADISSISNLELTRSVKWTAKQPWLDDLSKHYIDSWLNKFEPL